MKHFRETAELEDRCRRAEHATTVRDTTYFHHGVGQHHGLVVVVRAPGRCGAARGLLPARRRLKRELPAATKRNSAWPHASCGTLRVRGHRRG